MDHDRGDIRNIQRRRRDPAGRRAADYAGHYGQHRRERSSCRGMHFWHCDYHWRNHLYGSCRVSEHIPWRWARLERTGNERRHGYRQGVRHHRRDADGEHL